MTAREAPRRLLLHDLLDLIMALDSCKDEEETRAACKSGGIAGSAYLNLTSYCGDPEARTAALFVCKQYVAVRRQNNPQPEEPPLDAPPPLPM